MNRIRCIPPLLRYSIPLAVAALAALAVAQTRPADRLAPPVPGPAIDSSSPGKSNPPPAHTLPPAANLRIRTAEVSDLPETLLDPAADLWVRATPTDILLNRSPRIYGTEQPAWQRPIPHLTVRAIRSADRLYLLLDWTDATRDAPQPPPAKTGEGGDPARLYHRPTAATATFADAAAVMVPDDWTRPAFPSLMMGDAENSVSLYAWHAAHGAALMSAAGRATPQPVSGFVLAHRAVYADGHWRLTLQLPNQPAGYPLAFAVWDGAGQDRDGLKFFSIWYMLSQ
ncbi:MAG: hypothetical protein BIFFINMI_02132 [Phycisphaerae bacterium]|nr:hypothetical protein [Phycisphaerae bacterium]